MQLSYEKKASFCPDSLKVLYFRLGKTYEGGDKTMQRHHNAKKAVGPVEIEFTDKPMTPYGGLVLLARFFDQLKLRPLLASSLPDQRTSPNARPVVEIVFALFAAVAAGATRFAHVGRLRWDVTLPAILQLDRIPSAATLTRYFGSFTQGQVERLAQRLGQWTFEQLSKTSSAYTLDLDSSVLTRYGRQQGARKGYNPKKPGRPSHRPLFAFLAEARILAHMWLRSGNTSDMSGPVEFLSETLAILPPHIKVQAVRADSGFHDQKFFRFLEDRKIPYAVYVRMDRRIQRAIAAAEDWRPLEDDPTREYTDLSYQSLSWDRPRRLVALRERIRPGKDNRGKMLFDIPDYTYTAIWTNMSLEAVEVWRFYNHRADVENRIKELKEDFGVDGFCLDSFHGTEAVLRLIGFLYNLITLFRDRVLETAKPRLRTIRFQILLVAGVLGAAGKKTVLRLSTSSPLRNRFESWINRIKSLDQEQLQCSWETS